VRSALRSSVGQGLKRLARPNGAKDASDHAPAAPQSAFFFGEHPSVDRSLGRAFGVRVSGKAGARTVQQPEPAPGVRRRSKASAA
jgi:hypothetical protein